MHDLCNTNHLLHVVPMRIMRRFSPIKRCGRGCVKISSSCAASYFRHSLWYASCFAISSFLHGLKSVRKCMKMCHFWFESGMEWKKNSIFFSFPYANFFRSINTYFNTHLARWNILNWIYNMHEEHCFLWQNYIFQVWCHKNLHLQTRET